MRLRWREVKNFLDSEVLFCSAGARFNCWRLRLNCVPAIWASAIAHLFCQGEKSKHCIMSRRHTFCQCSISPLRTAHQLIALGNGPPLDKHTAFCAKGWKCSCPLEIRPHLLYNGTNMDGMEHLAVCASSWLLFFKFSILIVWGVTGREVANRKMFYMISMNSQRLFIRYTWTRSGNGCCIVDDWAARLYFEKGLTAHVLYLLPN